nr:MAG TPA: hypothetical protein [Caudoviricetes sp.]
MTLPAVPGAGESDSCLRPWVTPPVIKKRIQINLWCPGQA